MPSIQLGIGPSKQLVEVDKKRKSFEGFNFCVEVLEFGLQRHVLLPVGFRQKKHIIVSARGQIITFLRLDILLQY